MNQKYFLNIAIILIVLGGIVTVIYSSKTDSEDINKKSIVQCIKENGSTFYGAFWCPHCAEQKEILGRRKNNYNYIECSTPDSKDTTQICKDETIQNYPTWKFENDPRVCRGVTPLRVLANITGCGLPDNIKDLTPREFLTVYAESKLETQLESISEEDKEELYKNLEEVFALSFEDKNKKFNETTIEELIEIETNLNCREDVPAPVHVENIEVEVEPSE